MAKKVTIDNMDEAIKGILNDYADDIDANIAIITKKIGQTGAKALNSSAKTNFNGTKYSKSWTSKTTQGRLYTTVTIYSRMPGLPHLLEYGHALVAGGRKQGKVDGRAHIQPVEEKLIKEYEREVTAKL